MNYSLHVKDMKGDPSVNYCYYHPATMISQLPEPEYGHGEENTHFWYSTKIFYRDRLGIVQSEYCLITLEKKSREMYTTCNNTENPGIPYTLETRHAYKTEYGK